MLPPPQSFLRLPVLGRLLPSIWKRYMLWLKPRFFVEERMGCLHLIDPTNIIDKNLVTKGGWEIRQSAFLAQVLSAISNWGRSVEFWDIGAHAGLYSIYLSRNCRLAAVHAFEPDARNHAQLNANLFLNGLTGLVAVHKIAVSDVVGEIPFYMADTSGRGGSRIGISGNARIAEQTIVSSVRLDGYLSPVADVIAAKIDVEGHERRVLDGMRSHLATQQMILQVELFEANQAPIHAYLEELGFKLIERIDYDHYYCNFEIGAVMKST